MAPKIVVILGKWKTNGLADPEAEVATAPTGGFNQFANALTNGLAKVAVSGVTAGLPLGPVIDFAVKEALKRKPINIDIGGAVDSVRSYFQAKDDPQEIVQEQDSQSAPGDENNMHVAIELNDPNQGLVGRFVLLAPSLWGAYGGVALYEGVSELIVETNPILEGNDTISYDYIAIVKFQSGTTMKRFFDTNSTWRELCDLSLDKLVLLELAMHTDDADNIGQSSSWVSFLTRLITGKPKNKEEAVLERVNPRQDSKFTVAMELALSRGLGPLMLVRIGPQLKQERVDHARFRLLGQYPCDEESDTQWDVSLEPIQSLSEAVFRLHEDPGFSKISTITVSRTLRDNHLLKSKL
eukprot:m.334718 g.334718  ORF g.334718 m.334718 type:complete len:353 (-) comp17416_c0_seq1:580-1638(-)